ncbi:MAG: hypothetical protein AAF989_07890, partial [Planctomycetota bacterium]
EPWKLDEDNLIEDFFGSRESVWVLLFDGSTNRIYKSKTSEDELRAYLTHTGREPPSPWRPGAGR